MPSTTSTSDEKIHRLLQAVQELSYAESLGKIMETVRNASRDLIGSDGVTFILRDGDMCYYADEEAISPLWKGARFPMSSCISGWSMMNRRSAVIENIEEDDRIPQNVYRPTFVKSLVMVPIKKNAPIGAIGNYWAEEHAPDEEELKTLHSLADVTAVAIENLDVYNELDKKVRERTAQLEAFSYSVAHDLKNPLAGMEMRLNSLEGDEKADTEAIQDVSKDLREAIERMKGMIDSLLELSQLGDRGVKKTWSDMGLLVQKVFENTKREEQVDELNIRIQELPMEYIDPVLFQRVWQNLISNAVKFTRAEDHPLIEIGMEEQQGERIYWIKDNGKGFRKENAQELFKAFRKLDPDNENSGSGIGLSMVQQIIYRHGGTIWAEGDREEGATFIFTLPWNPEHERIAPNSN